MKMDRVTLLSVGMSVLILAQVSVMPASSELFTALVHMEGLLDLEMELLGSLNSYITTERERYVFKESKCPQCLLK